MRKYVLGAALALITASSAGAADLPRPYAKAPIMDPSVNWSGFYLGASAGGAMHESTLGNDDSEQFMYTNQTNNAAAAVIGGTVGYNWQFGNGVVGIEADGNWSSFKTSSYNGTNQDTYSSKWDWFSTVRGRAGLAVGNALIYGTAGVAIVKTKNDVVYDGYSCADSGTYSAACLNTTKTGFTAGVGAEYMLAGNWSVKAEYLYITLPTKSADAVTIDDKPTTVGFKDNAHIARVGINYHFH